MGDDDTCVDGVRGAALDAGDVRADGFTGVGVRNIGIFCVCSACRCGCP